MRTIGLERPTYILYDGLRATFVRSSAAVLAKRKSRFAYYKLQTENYESRIYEKIPNSRDV